jgi:peptidoglycan/xylan/chitin deacetylase (PgdA/CDA1 family)
MKTKLFIAFLLILLVRVLTPDLMIDLQNKKLEDALFLSERHNFKLDITYVYSDKEEDIVVTQDIKKGSVLNKNMIVKIEVSKGIDYKKYNVNELGSVPIMMYHGIVNMNDNETESKTGNVDKDGYHRTKESFIRDLEFYYNNGYRMISLDDYVDGIIDVELGKSPIILTFDDGLINNINVIDEINGKIVIDPNSAVGILESFKTKYPDYNVTATFFLNGSLFRQNKYNKQIINWLVDNGYDVANHTYSHLALDTLSIEEVKEEVTKVYDKLEEYVSNKYVNIVSLPFGRPYNIEHPNFEGLVNTKAALRVGWSSEVSPFSNNFNPLHIKRIRAYDNNGLDFDIKQNFDLLNTTRYISDGNKDKITIKKEDLPYLITTNKTIITY